ncbi:MAG TPA: ATP-binding protein [Solirubrobacteraceae bacterium]|nr:ATP-binding protein [Solirubrobacteraceae bacterium]
MASNYWKAKPGPEEVARLRHAVAEYAARNGMPVEQVQDVALAVSEVVTNAVVHAFPDSDDGSITVMATVNGEEVTVRVVDDGAGLNPRPDSPGAGLGLSIAGRLAQRMVVEHPPRGGTEVRMSFALAG